MFKDLSMRITKSDCEATSETPSSHTFLTYTVEHVWTTLTNNTLYKQL